LTDDGLDLGICLIQGDRLTYAGAKMSLLVHSGGAVHQLDGDRRSIGYRRTDTHFKFTNREWQISEGDAFYLTTDGFLDQNGGSKNYAFGRSRFKALVEQYGQMPVAEQKSAFERELASYMNEEPQRDDITVLAFRPARRARRPDESG